MVIDPDGEREILRVTSFFCISVVEDRRDGAKQFAKPLLGLTDEQV